MAQSSTIVLALITCVPFGLAIRDTVRGTYALDVPALDDWDAPASRAPDPDRADAIAALQAKLEAEHERESEARAEIVHRLVGDEVASLGPAFAGIQLGGSSAQAEDLAVERRMRSLRDTYDVDPTLLREGDTLAGIDIRLREPLCGELAVMLPKRWSPGDVVDGRRVWMTGNQRVVLESAETCTLRFERVVHVADWLSGSRTSLVPTWAIGQPAAALVDTIGDRANVTSFEVRWTVPGIGVGTGGTTLVAQVRKGVVVSLAARVQTDPATRDAVIARVGEVTGQQPPAGRLAWASEPPIELVPGEGTLELRAGRPPGD